jgi:hypothetical protein
MAGRSARHSHVAAALGRQTFSALCLPQFCFLRNRSGVTEAAVDFSRGILKIDQNYARTAGTGAKSRFLIATLFTVAKRQLAWHQSHPHF